MAFEPKLEEDEKIEEDIALTISKKLSLRLVLTDKAAYWPIKKKFAVYDPIDTVKTDLTRIMEVYIGRKSAIGSLIVALFMIICGIIWTLAGYVGMPQALILGGLIFGILGNRRRSIRIEGQEDKFIWTAPITFGGGIKNEIESISTSLKTWADRHAIRTKQ